MRRSKKGNAIYTRVAFWRGPHGTIHMTIEGKNVAVTDDPQKPNGHATLYRQLNKLIEEAPRPGKMRPTAIQVQFVARDGTMTKGPKFKLPDSN